MSSVHFSAKLIRIIIKLQVKVWNIFTCWYPAWPCCQLHKTDELPPQVGGILPHPNHWCSWIKNHQYKNSNLFSNSNFMMSPCWRTSLAGPPSISLPTHNSRSPVSTCLKMIISLLKHGDNWPPVIHLQTPTGVEVGTDEAKTHDWGLRSTGGLLINLYTLLVVSWLGKTCKQGLRVFKLFICLWQLDFRDQK